MKRSTILGFAIITGVAMNACAIKKNTGTSVTMNSGDEIADWTPGSEFASLQVARTVNLMATSNPMIHRDFDTSGVLTAATCDARALRPVDGGPAIMDGAFLKCHVTLANGAKGVIHWEMGHEELFAAGTRTAPTGFSIKGASAEAFHTAFLAVTKNTPDVTWAKVANPTEEFIVERQETADRILRKEVFEMLHPQGFVSLDISIFTPVAADGRRDNPLFCSKMANINKYIKNADGSLTVDVEKTPDFRCDFYYRFRM